MNESGQSITASNGARANLIRPNGLRRVLEELRRHKLQELDLPDLSKGEARKIEIAQRLREETIVTVKWIAARLHMGSVAYVNNGLYLKRKSNAGMTAMS